MSVNHGTVITYKAYRGTLNKYLFCLIQETPMGTRNGELLGQAYLIHYAKKILFYLNNLIAEFVLIYNVASPFERHGATNIACHNNYNERKKENGQIT